MDNVSDNDASHYSFYILIRSHNFNFHVSTHSYWSARVTKLHTVTGSCSPLQNTQPTTVTVVYLLQYIPNNSALAMSFPRCPHSQPLPHFPPLSAEMHNDAQNRISMALFMLFPKPGMPFSWHKQILCILQGLHSHIPLTTYLNNIKHISISI